MKIFSLPAGMTAACGMLAAGTADAQYVTGTTYYYPTGVVQAGYATPYYAPYSTYGTGFTFGNGVGLYYGSGYRPMYNAGYYGGYNSFGTRYGYGNPGRGAYGYSRGGRRFR